ncbi:MAG: ABC transporter ATP-binding protein [Bdellovibrionales bacterium]
MKRGFMIEDNVAHELTFRHLFAKLWPFLKPYPGRIIMVLLLVVSYTLVGRALPLLFGYAVDHGIKSGDWQVIWAVAVIFFVCEVARATLAFAQSWSIQKVGNLVLYDIRQKLLSHVQSLSATFFDKTSSGRVMTRVTNDVHSLGELFSQGFTTIFINLVEIVSIVLALTAVSAPLTAVVVLMLPPLIWACARLSRVIRIRFGAAKRRLAMINAFTAESIGGMKVLQLFNQTHESRAHFDRLSGEYKDLQLQTVRLFATLWPVVEAFNVGTVASTLLVGGFFREQLALSPGQLAAYVLLVQSFFRPLRGILEKYNQLQNSLASADRVFQMFEVEPEEQNGRPLHERLRGGVHFKGVTFHYVGKPQPAVRDIELKINPGESVALVGRTGSGKTTLISLVQRLYSPSSGEILLDGMNLKDLRARDLRRRIGVVQQDNFMFRGSIADNISLMNPEFTRAQIQKAAENAHCQRLLDAHNGGLDSQVEERGANLSVGERQLIAFARVLAFDPDILILDEATANIDSVHERLIQEATAQVMKGRTSLIVAHRLSTVLHCDRIVLLHQGEILEQGSHIELMNLKGRYYELYTSQQLGEEIAAPRPAEPILN